MGSSTQSTTKKAAVLGAHGDCRASVEVWGSGQPPLSGALVLRRNTPAEDRNEILSVQFVKGLPVDD
jgi:hypothetical protein